MKLTLPTDSKVRKDVPLYSGCYSYFPAALAGVATHSKIGNDKHNPGEPLHHARGKSIDHADCIARHSMDLADMLAAFERDMSLEVPAVQQMILTEANALCWRALAWSQELHEKYAGAPLAPAARLPAPTQLPELNTKVDCPVRGCVLAAHDGDIHTDTIGQPFMWTSDGRGRDVRVFNSEGRADKLSELGFRASSTAPLKACSDSLASEPTHRQCDQTPVPSRASLHDPSLVQPVVPQTPRPLPDRG